MLGTVAMLAGAAWIGLLWAAPRPSAVAFFIVMAGGTAGAIADSLLGATLQATFRCPRCERVTEVGEHWCGARTTPHRGVGWMTNDAVNALATLAGAAVTAGLFLASS